MTISYRFEHEIKKRYYHLILSKDLFGDWVITKAWGGIQKATGRVMHQAYNSYEEAMNSFEKFKKQREQRGYTCRLE